MSKLTSPIIFPKTLDITFCICYLCYIVEKLDVTMGSNRQAIGCRIKKNTWNQFKSNTALAGGTNQEFLNKLIEAANRIDWSTVSKETQFKVIVEDDRTETEGLGEK